MRLIAVRHCQTDWNAAGRIQGQADIPLNAVGLAQAERVADRLANEPVAAVWCSDLLRARQTAEAIARRHGLTPCADARLREFSFGRLDGIHFSTFALRVGIRHASRGGDPLAYDLSAFGGETGVAVHARQREVLDLLRTTYDGRTVVLVGHGRSLRTLLVPLGVEAARRMENGDIVVYEP